MIGIRTRSAEIEHAHVHNRVHAGEVRLLRRIGFATRVKAMVALKPGRGTSRPGSPPRSHLGLIERFTRYAVDPRKLSVVIGPELLNRKSKHALDALEHGGNSITTGGRTIRVAARPVMNPAFVAASRLLPHYLTDSITDQPAT